MVIDGSYPLNRAMPIQLLDSACRKLPRSPVIQVETSNAAGTERPGAAHRRWQMCPACLSTVATIATGVVSSGGLGGAPVRDAAAHAGAAIRQSEGDDMEQPRIGTRDEWLAARKELLVKEKAMTNAQDVLAAERRQLPMVKVDKSYVFDTPSGSDGAGRAVRRQEPADDLSLHDGAGLGGRVRELLVPRRPPRRRDDSPRASRREADGRLARAARQHRGVPPPHGLEVRLGVVVTATTSTATIGVSFTKRGSPADGRLQLRAAAVSDGGGARAERLPEDRRRARSFTPTRPTPAAAKR